MNQVNLIGYIGRDVEIRHNSSGSKVASFTVATDEGYRKRETGEWVDRAEWHRIVTWAPGLIELLDKHGEKGRRVAIFGGTLRTRKWTDRDGIERWTTEIFLTGNTQVKFLSRPKDQQPGEASQTESSPPNGPSPAPVDDLDDEVPF